MVATATRTDVPYLRRRLKKGEVSAAPVSSTSLKLGQSSTPESSNGTPQVQAPRIPALPLVEGKIILSLEEPSVLLSKVQSALGSLVISGAEAFAWEGNDGFGALVLADGSDSPTPMYGNRKLIEFHKGDLIVGLRHFKNFRRLVVGTRTGMLKARLYDESEIIADGALGSNALLISRVGSQIEVRLEKINSVDLLGVFGIQVIP